MAVLNKIRREKSVKVQRKICQPKVRFSSKIIQICRILICLSSLMVRMQIKTLVAKSTSIMVRPCHQLVLEIALNRRIQIQFFLPIKILFQNPKIGRNLNHQTLAKTFKSQIRKTNTCSIPITRLTTLRMSNQALKNRYAKT